MMKRTSLVLSIAGIVVLLYAVEGSTSPQELPRAGGIEPTPEVELYVADGGAYPLGEIHIRCKNPTADTVLICFSQTLESELWSGDLSFRPERGNTARVQSAESYSPPGDVTQMRGYFVAPRSASDWSTRMPVSWFFDTRDAAPGLQRFVYTIRFWYETELANGSTRSCRNTSTGVIEFQIPAK
jgi:hypothetical protein